MQAVNVNVLCPAEKLSQIEEQVDELLEYTKQGIKKKARDVLNKSFVVNDLELMQDNYLLAKLFISAYFEELRPYGPTSQQFEAKLQRIKLIL